MTIGEVSGIKEQLSAARLAFTLNERLGLEPLVLPEDELADADAARTRPVWEDTRSLTPELAEFLHAERVCDLDVYHLGEDPFVVVCDEISDVHNLGAIIRSAECAGARVSCCVCFVRAFLPAIRLSEMKSRLLPYPITMHIWSGLQPMPTRSIMPMCMANTVWRCPMPIRPCAV